jgi:hypothetical protein
MVNSKAVYMAVRTAMERVAISPRPVSTAFTLFSNQAWATP